MKRIIIFCFSCLTLTSSLFAQTWLWGRQGIGQSWLGADGWAVTADKLGNAYETGSISSTVVFGADTLKGTFFLVKYDSNGDYKWAVQPKFINSRSSCLCNAITTDTNNNIFVPGGFMDTVVFGSKQLMTYQNYNAPFIVKYDNNGNVLWARQGVAASRYSYGYASYAITDVAGDVYVSGGFADTLIFSSQVVMGNGPGLGNVSNMFLVKYDANGNVLWAKQSVIPSKNGSVSGGALTIDSAGNVYMTGGFFDSVSFGSQTLTGKGGTFLIKFDANGNALWSQHSYNPFGKSYRWITSSDIVDKAGNIYMAGEFGGFLLDTIYFGSTMLVTKSRDDAEDFLAKYDANGNLLWAKQSENEMNNSFTQGTVELAKAANNDIYMQFQASACQFTFGGYSFDVPLKDSVWYGLYTGTICLAKLDSSGNILCASTSPLPNNASNAYNLGPFAIPTAIAMGADVSGRYVYLTGGNFRDTLVFNKDSLPAGNRCDNSYIARWQPCADVVYEPPPTTEPCADLFVPNAFSPNGDGNNDVFFVKGSCIKTMNFAIFDRWGNKVFETQNINTGWDGTYSGQPMNTGTYVYYLYATMHNGSFVEKHGDIALVR